MANFLGSPLSHSEQNFFYVEYFQIIWGIPTEDSRVINVIWVYLDASKRLSVRLPCDKALYSSESDNSIWFVVSS